MRRKHLMMTLAIAAVVLVVGVAAMVMWQASHNNAAQEPKKPPLTAKEVSSIPCQPTQLSLDVAHHKPIPPQCHIHK